jgi:FtsZ-interacting cell division protein ZipA
MSSKKKAAISTRPVKAGMRVRFAEDGVEGRVVWADETTVQIRWDDGERVTWKRTTMAKKGVEVLDEDAEQPEAEKPATVQASEAPSDQATPTEPAFEVQPPAEQAETPTEPNAPEQPVEEPKPEATTSEATTPEAGTPEAATEAKPKRAPRAKKPAAEKKMSALDAAAKVLADAVEPMNCKTLIDEMGKRGLWTSPNGATPEATLYAAILRELKAKGEQARFKKTDRGMFAFNATA